MVISNHRSANRSADERSARRTRSARTGHGLRAYAPPAWVPVADHAVQRIQAMILEGSLKSGDRLPSQRELCAQLEVSRTSLREALSVLEALGFIDVVPSRGAFVANHTTEEELRQRDWQIAARFSSKEVFEFRLIHESFAARHAAMRILDDEIDQLRRSLRSMEEAVKEMDLATAAECDFEFHKLIVEFSGNRFMKEIYLGVRSVLREGMRLPLSIHQRSSAPLFEHRQVIEALASRDPNEAERRMRTHVLQAASRAGVRLATSCSD